METTHIRWAKIQRGENIGDKVLIYNSVCVLIWGRDICWFWVWTENLPRQRAYLGKTVTSKTAPGHAGLISIWNINFPHGNFAWAWCVLEIGNLGLNILRSRLKYLTVWITWEIKINLEENTKLVFQQAVFGKEFETLMVGKLEARNLGIEIIPHEVYKDWGHRVHQAINVKPWKYALGLQVNQR